MHVSNTTGGRDMNAIVVGLEVLGHWSKSASLEEVTVIAVNERRKPFQERDPTIEKEMAHKASLERVIRYRTGYLLTSLRGVPVVEISEQAKECFQDYLSAFRDARDGCLAGIKRKMIVNTNFGELSPQAQYKYLKEALMDPNVLMMELNEAFGGELWIDGRLCFMNGVRMATAFQVSKEEDFSGALKTHRADLAVTAHDKWISAVPKTISTSGHDIRARAPWGQMMEVQASVLDLVE